MGESSSTPAGRAATWLLDRARTPDALGDDEIERYFDRSCWPPHYGPQQELDDLRNMLGPGGGTLERVDDTGGTLSVEAVIVGSDGRRWMLACGVEPDPPHRLSEVWTRPAPPPGTVIRAALGEDGPALADLERRAPLRLGPLSVTYDRGSDYFAGARLMEKLTILVALVDGVHAGVYWGAVQHVLVGGQPRKLLLEHRVRVLPEFQKGGVFWTLVGQVRGMHNRQVDSIAFYISPANHRTRRHVEDTPRWTTEPMRVVLPCAALADDPVGRRATAGVHEILNACHGREELFVPYTREALDARLARDPAQYGWDHLVATDRAVVGVGSGTVRMIFEQDGTRREQVRATVFDHGFVDGGEDDYVALLRAWCGQLAARGVTHLALFTSEASPSWPLLKPLAADVEPFLFWTFDIDEPAGAREHGFYVDATTF